MIWRRTSPSTVDADKPKGFDDFELRLGDIMRGERATLGKSLLDVQRELRIKATYIAAIENCDMTAFESPGFISGYIRSYARYLGMDPEVAYSKFCAEANVSLNGGLQVPASPRRPVPVRGGDPLAAPNPRFLPQDTGFAARLDLRAIGSVLVLAALIGGIGFGGWTVLQEVQRVQLAPVENAPNVVAEMDPLQGVAPDTSADVLPLGDAVPDGDLLARLYRPRDQALDVPILDARDGPIAAIDPRDTRQAEVYGPARPEEPEAPQVVEAKAPGVAILAVRPAWVRVQSADGTVLFEKILGAGERYDVPQMEAPARLRAGNSGSVYFAVNGQTYGPAAAGAQVVKNVALSPESLTETFASANPERDADLARILTAEATE